MERGVWRASLTDCPRLSLPLSLFPLSPPLLTQGAVIGIDDEDDSTFTITVDQKTFHFQGETYLFCLFFIPSLLFAGISSLSGHTRLHSSPVSLPRSYPAFKRLGLVDTNTRNACMDTMSRMLHTGASFLWILFKHWSELLLISGDEHESGNNLFSSNPERKLSIFFFVSSLAFLAVAEEEDCFLCASAVEPRELNSAAAGRPLWMSLNDRIGSKLQPCLLFPVLLCLFDKDLASPVYSRHLFILSFWQVFNPSTSASLHLCLPSSVFIFLLLTPNTKHPSNLSRTPPSCFLFVGSPTPVHGPPALSPSSCPLPCLCFEAVCSGSTSGRVRRKRAGLVACMPVLDEGSRGGAGCLPSGVCSKGGAVCAMYGFVNKVQGQFISAWNRLLNSCSLWGVIGCVQHPTWVTGFHTLAVILLKTCF